MPLAPRRAHRPLRRVPDRGARRPGPLLLRRHGPLRGDRRGGPGADVLLIDEVLAVGDAEFQRKCLDMFHDLKRRRKTIVLVSHDMEQVRHFCDHVVVFDKGRIVTQGPPEPMIARYLELVGEGGAPADAVAG